MAQTTVELKLLIGSVYYTQKTYLQVAAMQEIFLEIYEPSMKYFCQIWKIMLQK